jgi:sphingolipid delta-4 desaturase
MRSSVTTATAPIREPAKRSLTATADPATAKGEHDDNFFWTYTEEPHRTRRMAIIKAHPEVCSSPALLQLI